MATKTNMNGVLRSDCSCYYCGTCEAVFTLSDWSDKCDLCENELTFFECCYGECWQSMKDDFAMAFEEWCEMNETEEFYVSGSRVGWRNLSGHTGRMTTFDELMEQLTINGDFTLRWKLVDGELLILRSSHDEPMGASFDVHVWREGDDE